MHQLSIGLDELKGKVLKMGQLVEQSVQLALRAVVERDEDLARRILNTESLINRMEIEIDDKITNLLVLQHPVARDMRFLIASVKINTDLERMGDLATIIAYRAISLMAQPPLNTRIDAGHIGLLTQQMVLRSLRAFTDKDALLAQEVLDSDCEVDGARDSIARELLLIMQAHRVSIRPAMDLLFVVRSLERIADHATNIAEHVIFLVHGVDVRHQASRTG